MAEMGFAIGKAKASVAGAGCGFIPNPKLKLLEQVSEVMRFEHYPNGAGAWLCAPCSMRTRGNSISGRHSLQCLVFGSRSETHAEALGKRLQKPDLASTWRHRSCAVGGRSRTTSLQRLVSLGIETRTRLIVIRNVYSVRARRPLRA